MPKKYNGHQNGKLSHTILHATQQPLGIFKNALATFHISELLTVS